MSNTFFFETGFIVLYGILQYCCVLFNISAFANPISHN